MEADQPQRKRTWGRVAIVVVTVLAVAYWIGYPWTRAQCRADATKRPTHIGAYQALLDCDEQFPK